MSFLISTHINKITLTGDDPARLTQKPNSWAWRRYTGYEECFFLNQDKLWRAQFRTVSESLGSHLIGMMLAVEIFQKILKISSATYDKSLGTWVSVVLVIPFSLAAQVADSLLFGIFESILTLPCLKRRVERDVKDIE